MLFKSPVFAQASGSIAGMVFSHNRGGQYVRSRATPTDPATALQVEVRSAMTSLAVRWIETLTTAQRDAWATYASNVEMTNRVGDAVFLTGQQHYLRSNIPRVQLGLDSVDDGPTVFDLGELTPPTLAAQAPSNLTLSFTDTDDWVDETDSHLLFYSSKQQNPTINYFKGPFRFADRVDGDDSVPPTSPVPIASPTALTEGNFVFSRTRVSRVDGRLSGIIDLARAVIAAA
jgi:hypothetical protein